MKRHFFFNKKNFQCLLLVAATCGSSHVSAQMTGLQNSDNKWVVNAQQMDIHQLILSVAKETGKTIIVDPRVKGRVQIISSKPLDRDEYYALFLSILEVHGYAAIESGELVRVIPAKKARTSAVNVSPDGSESALAGSEITTQVIHLENMEAVKLLPILRPLVPQEAHIAAFGSRNALIISDSAANIQRLRRLIQQIDHNDQDEAEIVYIKFAAAKELEAMLIKLHQKQASESQPMLVIADSRTNSLLINGSAMQRQRIKTLIKQLDTPLSHSGNVKVIYLEYAKAVDIAATLSKIVKNIEEIAETEAKQGKKSATVEADETTNALIITADAGVMQSLVSVTKQLDIRRAQVLVEAIIVEISDQDGFDLGVEWLFLDNNGGYGAFNNSGLNRTIAGSTFALDDNGGQVDSRTGVGRAITSAAGQVLGFGRLDKDLSFSAVLNALQSNTKANILSTPSLLTLDNEEASIVVGQSVPFVTGSYTSTGDSSSNPGNPFQTVQRENVGINLTVTPQINEGDSLVLAIDQEVSTIVGTTTLLNSNPITNERKISTTVLADDGQTIVLGGLIQDQVSEVVRRVPVLGHIPLVGALFRSSSTSVTKQHLVIFLRSTIIRDNREMDSATAQKYSHIRDQQLKEQEQGVYFIDSDSLPVLPKWALPLKELEELEEQKDESAVGQRIDSLELAEDKE